MSKLHVAAVPARDLSHLVTDTTRRGDIVKISGEVGTFVIVEEVLNVANGAEWVQLYGGPGYDPQGSRGSRFVRPDTIRSATPAEARKAFPRSLASQAA